MHDHDPSSPVIRTVILQFPTRQDRTDFIDSLELEGYTLHKHKPVLYCKLSKDQIELAITKFKAKDISYHSSDNYLFGGFMDTLGLLG